MRVAAPAPASYRPGVLPDKKFSIILSKSGDNLLYADKAFDITSEVIAGLNKAYKKAAAKAEPKKEAAAPAKK